MESIAWACVHSGCISTHYCEMVAADAGSKISKILNLDYIKLTGYCGHGNASPLMHDCMAPLIDLPTGHYQTVSTVIGASLSEPHTSMTALLTCVCIRLSMNRPLTVNFKWAHIQIFHEDRYRAWSMWRPVEGVRMQRRRPRAKTTEVVARMALVCASTDDGRPLTGGTTLICWRWLTVVDWVASGSGPCISKTTEI